METKIVFRAKRSDDGVWVYGDLTHVQKICSPEEEEKTGKPVKSVIRVAGYDVDENTIGQFLFSIADEDLNYHDVYVGDIVSFERMDGKRDLVEIEGFLDYSIVLLKDVTIEGNKFDNPALLESI